MSNPTGASMGIFGSGLDFEPVTRSHILHCSYNYWHPKYRSSAIKSKIIHLPPTFIKYLCTDGIILSNDSFTINPSLYESDDSSSFLEHYNSEEESHATTSSSSSSSPTLAFPKLHEKIRETIEELGGLVAPKLNWSSPKDATWISMKKNSMECSTPDDIYLLLKSSDFITFDLEHIFDDTVEDQKISKKDIEYVLVLRKWFHLNSSFEFRCFVRERKLIAISQRDLNYFDFLSSLSDRIRHAIIKFFNKILKDSFPDPNFVFDIYLPEPFDRVRLIDINAWAPRTDPLLFSWQEIFSLSQMENSLQISSSLDSDLDASHQQTEESHDSSNLPSRNIDNHSRLPEIRLVKKTDKRAFNYASSQYSAHKMPQEVVQAGFMGEKGIQDFATQWEQIMRGEVEIQSGYSSSNNSSDDDEND